MSPNVATGAPQPPIEPPPGELGGVAKSRRAAAQAGKVPQQGRPSRFESFVTRIVLTAGIVGIGVAIAAIMHSQKSQGWLIGLVVSIVSVVLTAFLWSSRRRR